MVALIITKKCTCARIQLYLFLASILEKNANGCNVHKEGYTKIFRRVAYNNQKVGNDLISISRGTVTPWKAMRGAMP